MNSFQQLRDEWEKWSLSADRSEDGWEANFPAWNDLMQEAMTVMKATEIRDLELGLLEFCWRISEEDEVLIDHAKMDLQGCWSALSRLAHSAFPEVRWQVYEALSVGPASAASILISGICDEDSYCRRRALISLSKVSPRETKKWAVKLSFDPDPQLRKIATNMINMAE